MRVGRKYETPGFAPEDRSAVSLKFWKDSKNER